MIVVTWCISLAEISNGIVMPNMKVFYIKIKIIIIIIISYYILSQHNRIINKRNLHSHIIINKRNK